MATQLLKGFAQLWRPRGRIAFANGQNAFVAAGQLTPDMQRLPFAALSELLEKLPCLVQGACDQGGRNGAERQRLPDCSGVPQRQGLPDVGVQRDHGLSDIAHHQLHLRPERLGSDPLVEMHVHGIGRW